MRIISVGKQHESWLRPGIERYSQRLRPPFTAEWVLVPHSTLRGAAARQAESRQILQRIRSSEYVVLLDETGQQFSSPQLAAHIERLVAQRPVVLVIGGAYGVDETVHARADMVWSLSRLVLPHMLVRLVLIEQLYRAQEICRGGPYHHS